jgi:O-acetyl-ADP-ribose deacetylase (regulator of RNase III)
MLDRIELLQADITTLDVDAIVNAANNSLMGGGGVDGAIHRAAGPDLKAYCSTLGGCETGQAKITPGFDLPADHVIHTVGPVWYGGTRDEDQLLASAYRTSLEVAVAHDVRTIAFPAISCGAYRFPIDRAVRIALCEVIKFLEEDDTLAMVYLVCFEDKTLRAYQRLMNRLTKQLFEC